jgi:hypothetical protein
MQDRHLQRTVGPRIDPHRTAARRLFVQGARLGLRLPAAAAAVVVTAASAGLAATVVGLVGADAHRLQVNRGDPGLFRGLSRPKGPDSTGTDVRCGDFGCFEADHG